ncbi:hypothetical protein RA8CHR_02853 [Variovorax sp. RA8]|nr:hypothetical protein RA8CHR_02853 [Variovorax sp. RA8]
MSGRARTMLEARNWQPQSLDDLRLSIELIATPEEQRRLIDHLLQYAQQPAALEPRACVQAAALLCHCAARNTGLLDPDPGAPGPSLDWALELAWTCASLLSSTSKERQLEADDLFAGAALILGNPVLKGGPARKQWECVGDSLLTGFDEQVYRVKNEMLLQLIEAHVRVARLGKRSADALVELYRQEPEHRPAIVKVLESLASLEPGHAKTVLKNCLEADQRNRRDQQVLALKKTLRELGFDYDWLEISGGLSTASHFNLLLKSGPHWYVEEEHRHYLEEVARITDPKECAGLLAFLAFASSGDRVVCRAHRAAFIQSDIRPRADDQMPDRPSLGLGRSQDASGMPFLT